MKSLFATFVLISLCSAVAAQSIQITVSGTASCCETYNSEIFIIASGGTSPYSYALDGGDWSNSQVFLTHGGGATHTVQVKDATGQTASKSFTINNYNSPPTLSVKATSGPSGCIAKDGSVTLQATGMWPPYTYSMDRVNWTNNPTFPGLPAGLYSFYVKDYNGCTAEVQYNSVSPCGGFGFSNINANCGQNGEIHMKAYPNTNTPITYSLDGTHYQSTGDFTDLTPGMHVVYVRDGVSPVYLVGCYIIDDCHLSIQGTPQDATCGNNDGKITASAVNGTPPYLYTIDGFHVQYQYQPDFINLSPGNYNVVVIDSKGMMASAVVTVGSGCPKVTAVATNTTCGNGDGTITATGSGGTPPYTYSLDGTSFQSSPVFAGLLPKTYTITMKDATTPFKVTASATVGSCLQLTGTPQRSTCGGKDGQITAAVSGGVQPYEYSLDGVNYQPGNIFTGLTRDSYTVTIKDANSDKTSSAVTVGEIPCVVTAALSVTDATCDLPNGKIGITAAGGIAPYHYSLDGTNFQDDALFMQLAPNGYTVTVKDDHGYTATNAAVVAKTPNTLTVDAGPALSICEGKGAVIQARSTGNSFSWQPSTGLNDATLLQPTASPSVTTLYSLTATDGGCQQTTTVNVIVNPAPVADGGKDISICYGKQTQLHGSGANTFLWEPSTYLSDPTAADPLVDIPAGSMTYSLTVTDGNGCQSLNKAATTVTVTSPPKLFTGTDTSVLAGQPVPLYAKDVNNSGFTTFVWSPGEGLSNTAIQDPVAILQEGDMTYNVTATTDAGCKATGSITIKTFKVSDIFVPTAFSPNGDGHNDVLRAVPIGIREFKFFAVFSRWGQRIFYTADSSAGWDGAINGSIQEAGTYVWMTGGIDYQGRWIQRKGTVLLVR